MSNCIPVSIVVWDDDGICILQVCINGMMPVAPLADLLKEKTVFNLMIMQGHVSKEEALKTIDLYMIGLN